MGILTGLCDGVVTALNAVTYNPTFTAERENVPRFKREDVGSVQVKVSPKSLTRDIFNRSRSQLTAEIYVLILKGLTSDSDAETDPLIALGESISDALERSQVSASGLAWTCNNVNFGADDDASFLSVVEQNTKLAYRGAIIATFITVAT